MSRLLSRLEQFAPKKDTRCRLLAMYSATIALADDKCLEAVIKRGQEQVLEQSAFYEIVLQSYLFLGFPRMLEAAKQLSLLWPVEINDTGLTAISSDESESWYKNGVNLCQQVYGNSYPLLKKRVESFAPEIFRWMIIEGYGKVLSRPGLTSIERELAIVACLIVENRPVQLKSHMRGALNVETDPILLEQVIDDMRLITPGGCDTAKQILRELNK